VFVAQRLCRNYRVSVDCKYVHCKHPPQMVFVIAAPMTYSKYPNTTIEGSSVTFHTCFIALCHHPWS
jgi:hypothetical protein